MLPQQEPEEWKTAVQWTGNVMFKDHICRSLGHLLTHRSQTVWQYLSKKGKCVLNVAKMLQLSNRLKQGSGSFQRDSVRLNFTSYCQSYKRCPQNKVNSG